jgi:uncharacterized coiled-coil DUF342 family protein
VLAVNEIDTQLKRAWLTLLEPETRTIKEIKDRLESLTSTSVLDVNEVRQNIQQISEFLNQLDDLESRVEDYREIKRRWLTPKTIETIIEGFVLSKASSEEEVFSNLKSSKLYEDVYRTIYRRGEQDASEVVQLADKFIKAFASYLWQRLKIREKHSENICHLP